jgi:hypothetical protein
MFHNKTNTNKEILANFGFLPGTKDLLMNQYYLNAANIYFNHSMNWEYSGDPKRPFKAVQGSQTWEIRSNDFLHEPAYTLLINQKSVLSFDDFPKSWILPRDIEVTLKSQFKNI